MSELYPVDQRLLSILDKVVSRESAIDAVTASGLPADKIIMGAMELHRMFEAEAFAASEEYDRIGAILTRYNAKAQMLKNLVTDYMNAEGIDELTIGTRTAALQLNNPAVVIDDESKIPPRYIITTQSSRIDKKGIAEAFKSGDEVEGAHVERTKSVRFK